MKWSKTISFARPLRNVQVARASCAPSTTETGQPSSSDLDQAYERGRRDGERALSEQLLQQRAEMAELQRGVLDVLRRIVPQVVKETETTLIRLALESAQKLVADMPISAEMIEAVVRNALRQVEDTSEITVQLHPADLALLQKNDSSLLKDFSGGNALRFASSSEVSRGGCLVQTRFGTIDARRETKLEALQRTLSV